MESSAAFPTIKFDQARIDNRVANFEICLRNAADDDPSKAVQRHAIARFLLLKRLFLGSSV